MESIKKLGELVECYDSKRVPLSSMEREHRKGIYPYYGAAGIIDYVDDYLFEGLFLLIGEDGSVTKTDGTPYLQLASGKFWVNNHAHVVRGADDMDTIFLYYALSTVNISGYVTGAVQPKLNQNNLQMIPVYFPEKEERAKIVEMLSAFDDKIELNRRMNETLEAIAQAIFKEWFVDFNYPGATGKLVPSPLGPIPEGWKILELSKTLMTIESGTRPKGGVWNIESGIPSIGAENIIGLGKYDYSKEKFIPIQFYEEMNAGRIKSGDVLLYKDGANLGRKTLVMDGFPHDVAAINEHVFILRSNTLINQFFLYFWLNQYSVTKEIINLNNSSAQPGISKESLGSLLILVPEKKIYQLFERTVLFSLKKLFSNCNESVNLRLFRDLLVESFYRS